MNNKKAVFFASVKKEKTFRTSNKISFIKSLQKMAIGNIVIMKKLVKISAKSIALFQNSGVSIHVSKSVYICHT